MIRALIFDFDGLIVDTEGPDFQAWQELYREHGAELTLETWGQVIGSGFTGAFHPFGYLEEQIGRPVDREALGERRKRREAELVARQPILPGVEVYLADAKRLGLKLGVASSSPHAWVDGHLERLGLLGQFDAILCRDDVPRPKPDPALFLAALDALAVRAQEAVVFEDSPHGVTAARRAGVYCVAVPNALTRQLRLDHADRVLATLAALPLADLLSELDGGRRGRLPGAGV